MFSSLRFLRTVAAISLIVSILLYLFPLRQSQEVADSLRSLNLELQAERNRNASLAKQLSERQEEQQKSREILDSLKTEQIALNATINQLQRDASQANQKADALLTSLSNAEKGRSQLAKQLAESRANSVSTEQMTLLQQKIIKLEREKLENAQTLPSGSGLPFDGSQSYPIQVGSVLSVGREGSFVVLDAGSRSGIDHSVILSVTREQLPIAKIQVYDVKENLSIARVLPESLQEIPQTGDTVTRFQ